MLCWKRGKKLLFPLLYQKPHLDLPLILTHDFIVPGLKEGYSHFFSRMNVSAEGNLTAFRWLCEVVLEDGTEKVAGLQRRRSAAGRLSQSQFKTYQHQLSLIESNYGVGQGYLNSARSPVPPRAAGILYPASRGLAKHSLHTLIHLQVSSSGV